MNNFQMCENNSNKYLSIVTYQIIQHVSINNHFFPSVAFMSQLSRVIIAFQYLLYIIGI